MHRFWMLTAAALVFSGSPALAQDKLPAPKSLGEAAEATRQALESMLGSFRGMVESLPSYEAPTMNENGDIIIRRKKSEAQSVPPRPLPKRSDELRA